MKKAFKYIVKCSSRNVFEFILHSLKLKLEIMERGKAFKTQQSRRAVFFSRIKIHSPL